MVDKVAVVTGAGSGIGRACAIRLARDAVKVAAIDLNGDAADETAGEIRKAGGEAIGIAADCADASAITTAFDRARAEFGPITILVNNAGITAFKPFMDVTEAEWDRMMAINLKGPFLCCQNVVPDMREAGWGRIVNISSSSAQSGAFAMVPYSASKGGVIVLTKSLALELAADGITVNNIPPGFVHTPMLDGAPVDVAQTASTSPMKRAGKPEELAAACAFLASDEASYITGQTLGVNGGRNPS